jgi:DnaJ-like protein
LFSTLAGSDHPGSGCILICMTERKPPGTSFVSWIDQQINEATERGAFDDLPGAGKPLPARGAAGDGQAWLRDYLRREGVSAEELLPVPLKLRKEVERLSETVLDLRSEQQVREVVTELNQRIMDWRRIPVGPPIFLPLVDEEAMVGRWRDRKSVTPSISPPAYADRETRDERSPRPRWWRRR